MTIQTNNFIQRDIEVGTFCERCRWQTKRAIRSGSGRNFAKRTASRKFRAPQQDIMGLTRKVAELITLQPAKAREFFDFLANASFFLNFE